MVYIIFIAWLVLDQISKYWMQAHFFFCLSIPVISNVFHFTYIINRGAAFGIFADQRWLFLAIVAVLMAVYIYFYKYIKIGPMYLKIGAALLLSGAIGNGIDRFRLHGVVDFLDFRIWPIFNIADIGICVGVVCIAYYVLIHFDDKD